MIVVLDPVPVIAPGLMVHIPVQAGHSVPRFPSDLRIKMAE